MSGPKIFFARGFTLFFKLVGGFKRFLNFISVPVCDLASSSRKRKDISPPRFTSDSNQYASCNEASNHGAAAVAEQRKGQSGRWHAARSEDKVGVLEV